MDCTSHCHGLLEQLISHYPESTRDRWVAFVEGQLVEINERNKIIPPSDYDCPPSASDDDDADFKDIISSHESGTAQVKSHWDVSCILESEKHVLRWYF